MKTGLAFFLALTFLTFAGEKYGVYDLQGNLVSTFEAESHELSKKARQAKGSYPHKKLYVSLLKKSQISTKPSYQYRFKTGAYVEAGRNETFSVCPSKEVDGTWVCEYSVALNPDNCLSVQTPNLAGSFDILFMENSGHTDTVQVLVDQSYIEMENYSHKIWTIGTSDFIEYLDSDDISIRSAIIVDMIRNGYYENRSYSQPLIVDKTMLIMGDAWHYSRINNKITFSPFLLREYPENEKLEESKLPLVSGKIGGILASLDWRIANERSKKEGLDTAYVYGANGLMLDTNASGYRLPSGEEWFFLMRAGASTLYYWGNEEDSLTVSRYEWVRPTGLKPVAQLLPNGFGLYDMVGIASERWASYYRFGLINPEYGFIKKIGTVYQYMGMSDRVCTLHSDKTTTCTETKPELKTSPREYEGFRLVRKTPKLHKLEKF